VRAAVSEASFATTQAQLAKASGDLAEAMKAVGLDSWPRFVADAQARARDPATVAAIEKSLQPPDLKKDAITPVYPVEKALATGAAAVTGGAAGLVGAAARAIGDAVAGKILGDASAPPARRPGYASDGWKGDRAQESGCGEQTGALGKRTGIAIRGENGWTTRWCRFRPDDVQSGFQRRRSVCWPDGFRGCRLAEIREAEPSRCPGPVHHS
jgi:hypothetical protein